MIIYKITNIANGKIYIGQTVQKNPKMRWYDHTAKARNGVNQPLFNAIRKYGVENFTWEVIDSANSLEALNDLEKQYVEQYDSINTGYNIREAGGNKLHNTASIEKMRAAQKAAHARRRAANGGVETINKRSGYKFNKPHPKKGKPSTKWTEEAKEKYRLVATEREARKRLAKQGQ